ncbi:hypothetical protein [Gilvimarinus agarilyticus]|uniref:hypothetical protein n=1 Tax=Gilvimarinus agarilyticus TaxID=679259 RepID=UPI0005A2BAF8|nr:hypothetical protein [Gilvimarinus agarilyticus]
MLRRSISLSVLLATLLTGLSGCAMFEPKSDEEAVTQRAQGWVDALLEQDYAAAYEFTSPGFKTRESARKYTKRYAGSGMWTKGAVEKVSCEVETCDVTVRIHYLIKPSNLTASMPLTESWLKVDGQWWLYHKK